MKEKKYKAFILIPLNNKFKNIFEIIIKKSLEENNFIVERANDIQNIQNILKDIVESIINADLIIADLTDLNPNVLYELGIAHTVQKPTVLITQNIDEIPFDLKTYRVIPYSNEFNQAEILYNVLKDLSKKLIEGKSEYSNPVIDFIDKRTLEEIKVHLDRIREVKREEIYKVKKGIIDFVDDGKRSIENIGSTIKKITDYTNDYRQELLKLAERKKQHERSKNFEGIKIVFLEASVSMEKFAGKIKKEMSVFQVSWSSFHDNVIGLVKISEVESKEDNEAVLNFLNRIKEFKEAIIYAKNSTTNLKNSTEKAYIISKALNKSGKELVSALDLLIANLKIGNIFVENIIKLINDKFVK